MKPFKSTIIDFNNIEAIGEPKKTFLKKYYFYIYMKSGTKLKIKHSQFQSCEKIRNDVIKKLQKHLLEKNNN